MKILALALALIPALAQASVFEQATSAATKAFRADYKAERGANAPEPVGYFLEKEMKEVISSVYYLDGSTLRAEVYGCHQHGRHFDCHREDRKELGSYSRSTNKYNAAEMLKSVPLAIEFFAKNVAPANTIESLKFWEAQDNIRYVVNYDSGKVFYLACHYHGRHMDCHRKRDAGPGEPQN